MVSPAVVINDAGEVAGVAQSTKGKVFGWSRSVAGVIQEFELCGNTGITAINTAGHFAGYCGGTTAQPYYDGFYF